MKPILSLLSRVAGETTFPLFGTSLLLGVMLLASYTFATALAAGRSGRPRTLQAARFGAYGTVALIGVTVLCLAYAFVSHDFRLRYVAHYSDRSMSLAYLLTALWGGQDGSLLWWLFLLSLYIGSCLYSTGKKHLELQPYVIATLMAVVVFFCVLMAFAANPFSTSIAGTRPDGEGLNPLLQNFYMIIHPPSLYVGFVGCTVPFAFAVAALVTGRLDHEWIVACRKWTLFAWLFLGIGNTLGMLWAYEELGWGGYWAWDPVENAAFMPFLVASAFVHSVMIQERRGMLKVWNVSLVCMTFFMTIFGTFLTRSGAIASVHSFAQSSIGTYFVWFLGVVAAFSFTLILYRWPELRGYDVDATGPRLRRAALTTGWLMLLVFGPGLYVVYNLPAPFTVRIVLMAVVAGAGVYAALELVFRRMTAGLHLQHERPQFESVFSREFTFMLNNWGLLGFMGFVLVATTFPMISEAFWNEKVSVGPPYYNAWVQPIGLSIFALMGIGTLFGWKKTSDQALKRAARAPLIATALVVVLHLAVGSRLGYPAIVWGEPVYTGALGATLRAFNAVTPLLGVGLAAFNAAILVQEFVMLFRARGKSGEGRGLGYYLYLATVLGFFIELVRLSAPSRRRYGGYVVHFGIVLMFLGFTGKAWDTNQETTVSPGQSVKVESYTLRYTGPRMEVDNSKRMVFADLKVTKNGKPVGSVSPAKFIYKKMPDSPTTEVAMLHSLRDDLYVVVGTVNPQTKLASLQLHVNRLVSWIWFGAIILIFGSVVCMWPELEREESRAWGFARSGMATAASTLLSLILGLILALAPARAYADGTSSLHAGTVRIENPKEKELFASLRCMCGTCARDLLSTCACGTADDARAELRAKLQAGMSPAEIIEAYAKEHGTESLSVPPNTGALRAIYLVPLTLIACAGIGMGVVVARWRKPPGGPPPSSGAGGSSGTKPAKGAETGKADDGYDARLDEELKDLDG